MFQKKARLQALAIGSIASAFYLEDYAEETLELISTMPEDVLRKKLRTLFPGSSDPYVDTRFGSAIADFIVPEFKGQMKKRFGVCVGCRVKIFPIFDRVTIKDCEAFLGTQENIVHLGSVGQNLFHESVMRTYLQSLGSGKGYIFFDTEDLKPNTPMYHEVMVTEFCGLGSGSVRFSFQEPKWSLDYCLVCFYKK